MNPLPRCRCGGRPIERRNVVRGCWDVLCSDCRAGFWGLTLDLARVEWGRAMRHSTYTLDAEPMNLGLILLGS